MTKLQLVGVRTKPFSSGDVTLAQSSLHIHEWLIQVAF